MAPHLFNDVQLLVTRLCTLRFHLTLTKHAPGQYCHKRGHRAFSVEPRVHCVSFGSGACFLCLSSKKCGINFHRNFWKHCHSERWPIQGSPERPPVWRRHINRVSGQIEQWFLRLINVNAWLIYDCNYTCINYFLLSKCCKSCLNIKDNFSNCWRHI